MKTIDAIFESSNKALVSTTLIGEFSLTKFKVSNECLSIS